MEAESAGTGVPSALLHSPVIPLTERMKLRIRTGAWRARPERMDYKLKSPPRALRYRRDLRVK